MTTRHALFLATALGMSVYSAWKADCSRALRRLEGWTIIKVSTIKGAFNGCEHDRLVELADGSILRCASYGYQFGYSPDAILFAKTLSSDGKSFSMLKLLVDNELYDMAPVVNKP